MKRNTLLLGAILAIAMQTCVAAQVAGTDQDVQIGNIDFSSQVLELTNFGSTSWALDGWRFCTHDEASGFRYTSSAGLNGQTLAAGESLSIHWNNDATSADAINVSSLGGGWISDLTAGGVGEAVQIGLYRTSSFGSSANLIDHLQYSFEGADINSADRRGGVATGADLWGSNDDWIAVDADSTGLALTASPFTAAGVSHTSNSFTVSAVPEPSALMLLIVGASGLAMRRRR